MDRGSPLDGNTETDGHSRYFQRCSELSSVLGSLLRSIITQPQAQCGGKGPLGARGLRRGPCRGQKRVHLNSK